MNYAGLILGIFALFLFGCTSETEETLSLRAEKAYAEKAYSKAIAYYEKLLEISGESPITYNNLALAAYQTQDYSYAIKMAEKALALGPKTEIVDACYELLGMVAEAEKDYPRAATYYRKTLASPDAALKVRTHSRLANVYMEQAHYDAALALLLTAMEINPADPTTAYNFGILCEHEAVNLRQAALDSFRLALRILPSDSPKHKSAALHVQRLEAYLNRLKNLPTITGDASACAAALKQMRKAVKNKNYKTAVDCARTATEADPSNFEAALELARLYKTTKNTAASLKSYDKAIALRPNAVATRAEAAGVAFDAKKYKDAANYLRPALVVDPTNRLTADQMARILYGQKQRVNAKLWFERYLRLDPNAKEAYRRFVKQLPEA